MRCIFRTVLRTKRKGSILIENLCALTIVVILFSFGSYMLSRCLNDIKNNKDKVKEDFYIKEAALFIEDEIMSCRCVFIDDKKNIISITEYNGNVEKIKLSSDSYLSIVYYSSTGRYMATNSIINNIEYFKLKKYNTYVKINIKGKYKGEIKKCIHTAGMDSR